jgi:hypothetical protein
MGRATELTGRERIFAAVFFGLSVAAVASPLVHGEDDFPLSSYPMFSWAREPVSRVPHVVGFGADGRGRPMPPHVTGTDEVLQAYRLTEVAIAQGAAASLALCERAARAVASRPDLADVRRLEVRLDGYDNVAYWKGERKPTEARVAARCDVTEESRP